MKRLILQTRLIAQAKKCVYPYKQAHIFPKYLSNMQHNFQKGMKHSERHSPMCALPSIVSIDFGSIVLWVLAHLTLGADRIYPKIFDHSGAWVQSALECAHHQLWSGCARARTAVVATVLWLVNCLRLRVTRMMEFAYKNCGDSRSCCLDNYWPLRCATGCLKYRTTSVSAHAYF